MLSIASCESAAAAVPVQSASAIMALISGLSQTQGLLAQRAHLPSSLPGGTHHRSRCSRHVELQAAKGPEQLSTSVDLSKAISAMGVAAVCFTLIAGSASAEDRPWRPRRHHRRLGERFSDTWAADVVADQERGTEQLMVEQRRKEQLQREKVQAETARRRTDEAARRKKAETMLAQQAKDNRSSNLLFSVKIGGREMAPFIVWGGLALMAFSAFKGVQAVRRVSSGRGKGKWVRDRSLGGKAVWVPAGAVLPTSDSRPAISDRELDQLASIAAAAGSATPEQSAPTELPTWWNQGTRIFPDASTRASCAAEANRLIARMEAGKNKGEDFLLRDIVRLRDLCQEGGVTVRPRTVGSRDALFRAAVDVAVSSASSPMDSSGDSFGDVPPLRFLCSLAIDIDLPPEKAVTSILTGVAQAVRARLLEALAGIKQDSARSSDPSKTGETTAVVSLLRLTALVEKLPVLSPTSAEVSLIAGSLQDTFKVDERRQVFYLAGQLYPEASGLVASLLGFDPSKAVPQLLADMAAYRKQLLEQAPKSRITLRPSMACRSMALPQTPARPAAKLAGGAIHGFEADSFQDLLVAAGRRLVVVDVFTTWCGPCKMIAPELENMARDYGDKLVIAKIDCTTSDPNKKWALGQAVKALPSFIMFKEGKRVNDMTGAKAKNLRKLIDEHI